MARTKLLKKFDAYLHAIGAEHIHDTTGGMVGIIRKNLPEKEPPEVQVLEKGLKRFKEQVDPYNRCVKEAD